MCDNFVTWIPQQIKIGICRFAPSEILASGSFIGNTTAMKDVFEKISYQFVKMYKKKQFLHLYFEEGIDEIEFIEAHKSIEDLITEYQSKEDVVVDLESLWNDEYSNDEEDSDEDE